MVLIGTSLPSSMKRRQQQERHLQPPPHNLAKTTRHVDSPSCKILTETDYLGNKCDLQNREVEKSEGEEFGRNMGCGFFETSAKNHLNIKEAFEELVRAVQARNEERPPESKPKNQRCILL